MVAQIDRLYRRASTRKAAVRLLSYGMFEGRPITTRGRWINPLVFMFFEVLKKLPQLSEVRRPIFLVGTGRAGTTIFGKVMSMHPDIGFLNEPKALWHSVYPDEDLIGNYSTREGRVRLDAGHATPEVRRRARKLFGAYQRFTGSRRVLDKYPAMIFRVPFLRAIFPDCLFLVLVRDGLDTCVSIDAWSKRHFSDSVSGREDWWGVDDRKWNVLVSQVVEKDPQLLLIAASLKGMSRQVDRAAVEWLLAMREGLRLAEDHPTFVKSVRYEDLTRRPEETLLDVAEFCGVSPDPRFLEYSARALKPVVRPRPAIEINPVIRPFFEATMRELGYVSTEESGSPLADGLVRPAAKVPADEPF